MALDTGRVTDLHWRDDGLMNPGPVESPMPALDTGPNIGAALRAVREFKGLSLEALADTTRIRRSYLAAIEDMRLDALPSRPFTIGYIRAYAAALGLDGEGAVERYKLDEPAPDTQLRGPVGVDQGKDPRVTLIVIAGVLLIGSIIAWNVARRAMDGDAPPPHIASPNSTIAARAGKPDGPVSLGAPLPAPVESTTPEPYVTPGLAEATAAGGSSDAVEAAKKAAAANPELKVAEPAEPLPPTFVAKGPVFGAEAAGSQVTFQARKSASLIVRGADGAVYFARQLSGGEAYRAPTLKGLSVEVSDPAAFQVFSAGRSMGLMSATTSTVEKFAPPPAPRVAPAAAAPSAPPAAVLRPTPAPPPAPAPQP